MIELLQAMLEIQELQLIRNKNPERNALLIELRQKVPPQILAHLDRLLDRGKKGIAVAHNGVCMECHMRIPIGDIATLMHGDDIQLCANCGRYLYLPENELPSHQPPPPAPKPKRKKKNLTETADVQ